MTPESRPPAKLCPRCGAFYQDLRSQTCPQCFARLDLLDEETASHLAAEQQARIADPTLSAARAQEDEKFKEQSFGACLAIAGLVVATLVVAAVIIAVAASHYRSRRAAAASAGAPPARQPSLGIDDLLPTLAGGTVRERIAAAGRLPGGATLYQGYYDDGVQVWAAAGARVGEEQEQALELAARLAAEQHNPPLVWQEITTPKAHYAILGKSAVLVGRVAQSLASGS